MEEFRVSVNIPVYNAAPYLRQAVESALEQRQTGEIIIVEDCSPDKSWEVCEKLAAEYSKVHLFRHPDGRNHGCSASRSLAVQKSSFDYIAFLDADDFYLPGRFEACEKMFYGDPELEGVYEAIGTHIEDEASLKRWPDRRMSASTLTTITKEVPHERLFFELVAGTSGYFTMDGLVVKRNVFKKTGYFDQTFPLNMDDVFQIKLAALAKLAPGIITRPVAMRRVHGKNRISAPRSKSLDYKYQIGYWYITWNWSKAHLEKTKQQFILKRMIKNAASLSRFNHDIPKVLSGQQKRIQLILLLFSYPSLLIENAFWRAVSPSLLRIRKENG